MKKIYTNILSLLVLLTFGGTTVFAQATTPMNAKFYVTDFTPNTGDTVEFDLKVEGNSKKPTFTVKVNLEYDKDKLQFVESVYQKGFIAVPPDEVTDTANGKIIRTAGYPGGLKTLTSIVKYKFKAIAPGEADVKIVGDSALDEKNNDIGLQNKKITVTIKGEAIKTENNVANDVKLNITGADTFVTTSGYPFNVEYTVATGKQVIGTTTVSIFDSNGEKVLTEDKSVNISQNSEQTFNIQANALIAGTYSLIAENKIGNNLAGRATKEIKVTGGDADITAVAQGESSNVFINIWNTFLKFIVENIYKIVGLLFIILLLKFISSKIRRYRRRDR